MNIYDFADSINQNLVITRHSNPKIFSETKFTVCFENAEIKQGSILHSTYGRGLDIREALNDYTEQIEGFLLVFNARSKTNRMSFVVPEMEFIE